MLRCSSSCDDVVANAINERVGIRDAMMNSERKAGSCAVVVSA